MNGRWHRLVPRGSLTSRGRALLTAGSTTAAGGVVFGMDDLVRVGALLAVLPVVAAVSTSRRREQRLTVSHRVFPRRVAAGQPALVRLTVTNEGPRATPLLLAEDLVPSELGTSPRLVIDRMGAGRRRTVEYTVRSERRGRYAVGPLSLGLRDPFGLVSLRRTVPSTGTLVVTPPVVALPAIAVTGGWTGAGDNRSREFAGGSAEDVTVRDYRLGDELRRIHWRATAHTGQLMVRREEQPWQSRATLLLDNRTIAHAGTGPDSSLEYAVAAAASIATHLVSRGYRMRLVSAQGAGNGPGWHEFGLGTEAGPLLEALAVLGQVPRPTLDLSWCGEERQTGLVVAVLGATQPADGPALTRVRRSAATALAVALDVRHWSGRSAPAPDVAGLHVQGWQVSLAGPGDPLPMVWERLGGRRAPAVVVT